MQQTALMKKKILYLTITFAISSFLCAQTGQEVLKKQLNNYSEKNLQEKIFIHTDKSFYVPGEIMWFKAYVVDAIEHKPIDISKVAYIEILDQNNKAVSQAKIELVNGSGSGSFLIPVSITTGNFTLRAYTRWMRNFSVENYFEKAITIVNTLKTLSAPATPVVTPYDVQFFPEGGNLVRNTESKIAFKVSDHYGKGINCLGKIINQNNDSVTSFNTLRYGMGSFYLTPKQGDTYKAVITLGKDSTTTAALPAAYEHGYVMRMEDAGSSLKLTVTATGEPINQPLYLLSHTRQKVNFAEAKTIAGDPLSFFIDKKNIGDGITTFTLFNSARQPVCERLYFKKPATYDLGVKTDNNSYAPRNKVNVSLITGENTKSEKLDLSASVYLVDSLQPEERNNILSYIWLSSDLGGYVEDAGYYFTNTETEVNAATDNLVLTQGWRRFKWEDVLSDKKPAFEFIPEYEGHLIPGKIVDKHTGLPGANIPGYLSAPGKRYQFANTFSNSKGEVLFNMKDFIGGDQIVVQTNNTKDSGYQVEIMNPFSEKYSTKNLPPFRLTASYESLLLNHSINSQVQTNYIADSTNRFIYPFADTNHFFSPVEKTYYLDLYTRFTTMEEVLREYVMEVLVRKNNKKFVMFMVRNAHEFSQDNPLSLIDGVPFFNPDSIMAVDPLKIQKIELLSRNYYYGPVTEDGIVSYSTYKGNLEGIRLDPSAVVIEYEGLQLKRQFYSPLYETAQQKNSRTPDFRSLLYWSPAVHSSNEALSFYTSDLEGKYVVLIQGISESGKVFSTTSTFEVKR